MILRDLTQSVLDLGLVLFLTVLLLAALFVAGWWLQRRALKLHIKADRIARYAKNRDTQEQAARLNYTANFRQGMSTELFGAVVTTFAFGVVLLVFQQYQSIQNHKAELILQMGSPDNVFAIEAVRQISALGWLTDGTLRGADLEGSNLQGASFFEADLQGVFLRHANLQDASFFEADLQGTDLAYTDLQGANLSRANLQGAFLEGANMQNASLMSANLQGASLSANLQGASFFEADLQGAFLEGANMQNASLMSADLQGADLQDADLQGADLQDADLQGADLQGAILQGAYLEGARFSDLTVLPGPGYSLNWTPETDMTRYTDPNHPDFWQPQWVKEQTP